MSAAPGHDAGAQGAVLDTNVWLDLLVFRDAGTAPLLGAIAAGMLAPVIDAFGLAEFARVLGYPLGRFSVPEEERDAMLARCRAMSTIHDRPASAEATARGALPNCRDPFDQPFLELARDAQARWLVTKDRDLLHLARAARGVGFAIVTPRQCIEALAGRPVRI